MPQPNKLEDIFDNTDPSADSPKEAIGQSSPLPSLEEVIAQKKAEEKLPAPEAIPSESDALGPVAEPASLGAQNSPPASPPRTAGPPPPPNLPGSEISKTPPRPTQAPKSGPEDIFSEIDIPKNSKSQAGTAQSFGGNSQAPIVKQPPLFKSPKLFIILILLIGLMLIIAGGWFVYAKFFSSAVFIEPPIDELERDFGDGSANDSIPAVEIEKPEVKIDTDLDGLTDEEEALYGTDPTQVDTDKDGLTDYDEVKIFKTDPLNPDTDGDGYLDGEEVRAGYDPNGPGKLFKIP